MYRHGNTAIDEIFTTADMEMLQGGYDDILSASGDHPWVWGDFTITSILGGGLDAFTHPIARKLSCTLPAVRDQ